MRAKTTRMMVAYSSVAQIGYIFAALGLGNELGMLCALWHMLAHSATKSMLFISAHTLDHASGDTHLRKDLRGGFYRSPLAAAAFTLGAANLVGVPMLSVFVTKVTMAQAAVMTGGTRSSPCARWRFPRCSTPITFWARRCSFTSRITSTRSATAA